MKPGQACFPHAPTCARVLPRLVPVPPHRPSSAAGRGGGPSPSSQSQLATLRIHPDEHARLFALPSLCDKRDAGPSGTQFVRTDTVAVRAALRVTQHPLSSSTHHPHCGSTVRRPARPSCQREGALQPKRTQSSERAQNCAPSPSEHAQSHHSAMHSDCSTRKRRRCTSRAPAKGSAQCTYTAQKMVGLRGVLDAAQSAFLSAEEAEQRLCVEEAAEAAWEAMIWVPMLESVLHWAECACADVRSS